MAPDTPTALTRKSFMSDQEVRWCPGCGDYAILAALQRTLPKLGVRPENTVFVSGIGCSSRFPYYMNTYGFHTIHGRAPAVATGVKLANPDLDVWVITGDGDGLSIGGNHLLHALRRNVDLQILLFNNRVYGLTKGQYSPTSLLGQHGPSTPLGSVDYPVHPLPFALGAGARFVARAIDTVQKPLMEIYERAYRNKGASLVEILQNCPVFNDGAFTDVAAKDVASDRQLWAVHGQPLVFGKNRDKGLRMRRDGCGIEVVTIGEGGVSMDEVLVHDETNLGLASLLAHLGPPDAPMVFGVLYCNPAPTYEHQALAQNELARQRYGEADLDALLRSGHTWTVSGNEDG